MKQLTNLSLCARSFSLCARSFTLCVLLGGLALPCADAAVIAYDDFTSVTANQDLPGQASYPDIWGQNNPWAMLPPFNAVSVSPTVLYYPSGFANKVSDDMKSISGDSPTTLAAARTFTSTFDLSDEGTHYFSFLYKRTARYDLAQAWLNDTENGRDLIVSVKQGLLSITGWSNAQAFFPGIQIDIGETVMIVLRFTNQPSEPVARVSAVAIPLSDPFPFIEPRFTSTIPAEFKDDSAYASIRLGIIGGYSQFGAFSIGTHWEDMYPLGVVAPAIDALLQENFIDYSTHIPLVGQPGLGSGWEGDWVGSIGYWVDNMPIYYPSAGGTHRVGSPQSINYQGDSQGTTSILYREIADPIDFSQDGVYYLAHLVNPSGFGTATYAWGLVKKIPNPLSGGVNPGDEAMVQMVSSAPGEPATLTLHAEGNDSTPVTVGNIVSGGGNLVIFKVTTVADPTKDDSIQAYVVGFDEDVPDTEPATYTASLSAKLDGQFGALFVDASASIVNLSTFIMVKSWDGLLSVDRTPQDSFYAYDFFRGEKAGTPLTNVAADTGFGWDNGWTVSDPNWFYLDAKPAMGPGGISDPDALALVMDAVPGASRATLIGKSGEAEAVEQTATRRFVETIPLGHDQTTAYISFLLFLDEGNSFSIGFAQQGQGQGTGQKLAEDRELFALDINDGTMQIAADSGTSNPAAFYTSRTVRIVVKVVGHTSGSPDIFVKQYLAEDDVPKTEPTNWDTNLSNVPIAGAVDTIVLKTLMNDGMASKLGEIRFAKTFDAVVNLPPVE